MRTTLDIDEDVLQSAKEIAAARKTTAGKVISELARRALRPADVGALRNGVPLLPEHPDARLVTPAIVERLLDEEP